MRHSSQLTRTLTRMLLALWVGWSGQTALTAQGCRSDQAQVGWLGITRLAADRINVQRRDGRLVRAWFGEEPLVEGILPSGPADGKLRRGDRIVAVDGHPITTQDAARTLLEPVPNAAVVLGLRRQGEEREEIITALSMCPEDVPRFLRPTPPLPPSPPPAPPRAPVPHVGPPEASPPSPPSAPVAPEPPRLGNRPAPLPPPAPDPPPPPPPPPQPRAWLGFGFECSYCSSHNGVFSFSSGPVVYSVDVEGPAAAAGLRRGDVLLEIDELPLTDSAGAKRFFEVKPGETIEFLYRRGDETGRARLLAQPPRGDDRRRFSRIVERVRSSLRETSHSDLHRLRHRLEQVIAEAEAPEEDAPQPSPPRRLRYAGVFEGVDVEVRAVGGVTVDETPGELLIHAGQTIIRLTRPGSKED